MHARSSDGALGSLVPSIRSLLSRMLLGRGVRVRSFSPADRALILAEACRPPSDAGFPVTHWSRALLVEHLWTLRLTPSERTVGRILREAALQPHRQRMWLTSHDEEFRAKRDDVLRTYYETPEHEHIICVDEKTQMQALERVTEDWAATPGCPVRRSPEYIRHGTQVLMGAWDVRRGRLFGFVADRRGIEAFVELLDLIDACYPEGCGHIICDNLADHLSEEVDEWFEEHPRWKRHLTPKRASWLNQIEIAFGTLQRQVIERGSFDSKMDLSDKVLDYMQWELRFDRPFDWSYRPESWRRKAAKTPARRH